MSDKMREEFEDWIADSRFALAMKATKNHLWETWQASRASDKARIDELARDLRSMRDDRDSHQRLCIDQMLINGELLRLLRDSKDDLSDWLKIHGPDSGTRYLITLIDAALAQQSKGVSHD